MKLVCVCVGLAAAVLLGSTLPAQVRPRPNIPFATVSLGIGTASGAGFIQRNTLDLDATGGVLFHNRRTYSLVAGGFVGATGGLNGSNFICTTEASLCPRYTPTVEYTGFMFGIESAPLQGATSMGVTLGPTLLQTARLFGTDSANGPGSRFGGVQIRIDGVRRVKPKLRLVFGLRTTVVPSYAGRRLTLSTFSLGLRFQTFQPFN